MAISEPCCTNPSQIKFEYTIPLNRRESSRQTCSSTHSKPVWINLPPLPDFAEFPTTVQSALAFYTVSSARGIVGYETRRGQLLPFAWGTEDYPLQLHEGLINASNIEDTAHPAFFEAPYKHTHAHTFFGEVLPALQSFQPCTSRFLRGSPRTPLLMRQDHLRAFLPFEGVGCKRSCCLPVDSASFSSCCRTYSVEMAYLQPRRWSL